MFEARTDLRSSPSLLTVEQKTGAILEALPYICDYVGRTIVLKVGGSVGDEGTVLEDVVWLKRLGINPVIVHGGGPQISSWLGRMGVETRFVEGRRVTDEATLEVVHMVLMRVNGQFVSYLDARGIRAVGLNGLDGGMLRARLRDESLGLVGEVQAVDLGPIASLVQQGYVVVIAPLAAGPESQPLNVNADTVAGEVARALRATKFVLFTDVPGVMNADGDVLTHLQQREARGMIESGVIKGGMIPKVESCLRAVETVPRVHVIDGRVPHGLIRELFTQEGVGTMITGDEQSEPGRIL